MAAANCSMCNVREGGDHGRKFFVSVRCGHVLCQKCLDTIYDVSRSSRCYGKDCHSDLLMSHFEPRTEEEKMIYKEIANRRELARIYNLHKEDFQGTPEYYDYLEEMEDVVYDKTYEPSADVQARIASFQKTHHEQITVNAARIANEKPFGDEDDAMGGGNGGYVATLAGGGLNRPKVGRRDSVAGPPMPEPILKPRVTSREDAEGQQNLQHFMQRQQSAAGFQRDWREVHNWQASIGSLMYTP